MRVERERDIYSLRTRNLTTKKSVMACKTVLRSIFLMEPWSSFHLNRTYVSLSTPSLASTSRLGCRVEVRVRVRDFNRRVPLNCSNGETPSSSSQDDHDPPQEAVLKAISGAPHLSLSLSTFLYL